MSLSEFDIIQQYFTDQSVVRDEVRLGIGDDAALLAPTEGLDLAVAMDTLVENIHFLPGADPANIGYKALAVNLSDLAAMGAAPAWFNLALTLPAADPDWLHGFSQGLLGLAKQQGMQLIGGDTTHGPLTVSVQVGGYVPSGKALTRAGAQPGDHIYVTGTLGDAAMGLILAKAGSEMGQHAEWLVQRLHRPQARIAVGLSLSGIASACIDISDGLFADLQHLLSASQCGAQFAVDAIPLSTALHAVSEDEQQAQQLACSGGDDYELCFSVAPDKLAQLEEALSRIDCPCTAIGQIEATPGLRLVGNAGEKELALRGYDHFAMNNRDT